LAAGCFIAAAAVLAGCSGKPGRVYPPKYGMDCGAAALALYDANRDGAIDGDEFDNVPGLREALKQVDTNGDGRLTAEEIDARVQAWLATRMGEMAVNCEVSLDDKPLVGATLLFEPEPFLGPVVHPASGETDEGGGANVSMAPEHLANPRYRGVAAGWYKIRVTHPGKSLPAKYNTETKLGCEVSMRAYWVNEGAIKLKLKSDAPENRKTP
jgi:hypothetical protein